MKTRQGFVSNSSTSSFLVVGVEVDVDYNQACELTKNIKELHAYNGSEDGFSEDTVVIGHEMASWDECGYVDDTAFGIGEIVQIGQQIAAAMPDICNINDVKVYCGTRMC